MAFPSQTFASCFVISPKRILHQSLESETKDWALRRRDLVLEYDYA
jgi:hypothetical protein